jgi:hypothetical protein
MLTRARKKIQNMKHILKEDVFTRYFKQKLLDFFVWTGVCWVIKDFNTSDSLFARARSICIRFIHLRTL